MNKKILIIFTLVITLFFSYTYASDNIVDIIGGGEIGPEEVDGVFAARVLGAFQWSGFAIAIGMLVYIGIKYLLVAPDERSDLKNALVKYVAGSFLIIGAVTFVTIIFNSVQGG